MIRQKKNPSFAFCLSRSLKVIGTDTNRSATYDFLLVFHSNYMGLSCTVSEKKMRQCPGCGVPFESCNSDGLKKTGMRALTRSSKKCDDICICVYRHNTGIGQTHTDRQTDGRICHINIAFCMHCMLTRDKKKWLTIFRNRPRTRTVQVKSL